MMLQLDRFVSVKRITWKFLVQFAMIIAFQAVTHEGHHPVGWFWC